MLVLALPQRVSAQDDRERHSAGRCGAQFSEEGRSVREWSSITTIFRKVVEDAESRRAAGSTMVFSLDPGGKSFHVSSPDVSCSLTF